MNKEKEAYLDIGVVGGGIVGAAFALALAGAEVSVGLVEPRDMGLERAREGADWDSRVYALTPGNAAWLRAIGVWDELSPGRLARVETMRIYGDRSPGALEFDAYEAGLRELAWIVEHGELSRALWLALERAPAVELHCPCRVADLMWMREAAELALADGRSLTARLIVAADGADSWVRERAGIAVLTEDYREVAVVANFAIARPHDGVAYQWFRHDGVLAMLPLAGDYASMVWSAPAAHAAELLAASAGALAQTVRAASAGRLGALEVVTPARGFPLRRQRVARLVEPRVALIGDAAHNVHPLAGQGMNLGLRDARTLAEVLARRGPVRDCGDFGLLRRFERARWEDILAVERTTDALQKLFSHPAVPVAGLRNAGLALTDRLPPLKNFLVRHAIA
jgi:2-polyprenylphenol 6-hydroxylase